MGGLFTGMGYFFGVVRFYFYGWMIGLANFASIYMEHNAGWTWNFPLAVVAWILLLIGFAPVLGWRLSYGHVLLGFGALVLVLVGVGALVLAVAPQVYAQSGTVESVQVQGLVRMTNEAFAHAFGIRAGDPYDPARGCRR